MDTNNDNLSVGLNSFEGNKNIFKAFCDELEKAKGVAAPIGTINKWNEMKMPDGTWKYVGKKGINHPGVQHVVEKYLKGKTSTEKKVGIQIEKPDFSKQTGYYKPGDTNTKNGVTAIKTTNQGGWVPLSKYLESWGGEAPTGPEKFVGGGEQTVKDFLKTYEPGTKSEPKPEKPKSLLPDFEGEDDVVEYLKSNILDMNKAQFDELVSSRKGYSGFEEYLDNTLTKPSSGNHSEIRYDMSSFANSMDNFSNPKYTPKNQTYSDFSGCSKGQILMISAYTGSGYKVVNRFNGNRYKDFTITPEMTKALTLITENINDGLANIKNNKNHDTVWRGYNSRAGSVKDQQKVIKEKMINYAMAIQDYDGGESSTVTYGTIASTSAKASKAFSAEKGINYRIEGVTSGKDVREISQHPGEDELIFPTTTQFTVKEAIMSPTVGYRDNFGKPGRNFVVLQEI
jgi:hypothetical protein